ncbi:MAG: DUF1905 domain-containing protein [Flavobacterium sp.]|nr:MAG: DUF1905 domain-containing protein [Flavobacterium sp.]
MIYQFKAKIYKIGINWAVDVPHSIAQEMMPEKGYIRIKGQINDFDFIQTLVPVKNAPYRLFVNQIMMGGGKTALGETATFAIAQNHTLVEKLYPIPQILSDALTQHHLNDEFNKLSAARRKDIFKYLSYLKNEETIQRNINKLIVQLQNKDKNARIP